MVVVVVAFGVQDFEIGMADLDRLSFLLISLDLDLSIHGSLRQP
jgi:hypothetical protein